MGNWPPRSPGWPTTRRGPPGSTASPLEVVEGRPLGPFSTLGIGGPARAFAEVTDEDQAQEALRWARQRGLPVRVLGGGSNLVVADEGVPALVVRLVLRGIEARDAGDAVEVTAAAGEGWDDLVRLAAGRGWAGLECLSGIPGLVGATPIQNVGAYGQDVSETVAAVRALDRARGEVVMLEPEACGFDYRDSRFKRDGPDRWVVLAVTFRLRLGPPAPPRYADLVAALARRGLGRPSLDDVREAVLAIRRAKSMVLDPADENRRSCGSFFMNPVVTTAEAARVGAAAGDPGMPRWPQPGGGVKLSAAWLIERAGFRRGWRVGPVGLSTRHSLAVVAHEGARARDVVRVARALRAGVEDRFGVRLIPEPVFWGFPALEDGLPALAA